MRCRRRSPDLVAVPVVEIDRIAPRRAIAICKVGAKVAKIIALRTQMIVNNIQNNAETKSVRRIDESLHPVGAAVRMMRRVEIDAVVSPSARLLRIRHRHQFDMGEPRSCNTQALGGGVKRTRGCERSDVQFVDEPDDNGACAPARVTPLERRMIDRARQSMSGHAAGKVNGDRAKSDRRRG